MFGKAEGRRDDRASLPDYLALALREEDPDKVEGEDRTRDALRRGEKLADVFARHGIL